MFTRRVGETCRGRKCPGSRLGVKHYTINSTILWKSAHALGYCRYLMFEACCRFPLPLSNKTTYEQYLISVLESSTIFLTYLHEKQNQ